MFAKNLMLLLLLSGSLLSFKCNKDGEVSDDTPTLEKDSLDYPIDMALIYHGGTQRKLWTKNQLKPYVYREKDGQLEWLFDGFLFLEIMTDMYGESYSFVVNDQNHKPANKALWEGLLDRSFAPGHGPGGLNELLDSLVKDGNVPPYRRKAVISIPNPTSRLKDWGSVDGKKLDFDVTADRITAAKWYIDSALDIWKDRAYEHLQLSGFYWVRESIVNESSVEVVQAISEYLSSKGLKFYWIPYYGAGKAGDWKELGFDLAYQQPNYFFNLATPHSTLVDALDFGKDHQMEMEMEFDSRINQPDFRDRFFDYLNAFDEYGVWKNRHVAYYEGGGAWLDMSKSSNQEVRKAFDSLADILAKRKKEGIK